MPYVRKLARRDLNGLIEALLDTINNNGELNYCLTRLLTESPVLRDYHGYNFIVAVLGTIEAVRLEFYRRVAVPYERAKERVNGDVLGYEIGVPSPPAKP